MGSKGQAGEKKLFSPNCFIPFPNFFVISFLLIPSNIFPDFQVDRICMLPDVGSRHLPWPNMCAHLPHPPCISAQAGKAVSQFCRFLNAPIEKKKNVTAEIHISADEEATALATAFPRSEIEHERERTQTNAGKSPVRKQSGIPAGRGAAKKKQHTNADVCKNPSM